MKTYRAACAAPLQIKSEVRKHSGSLVLFFLPVALRLFANAASNLDFGIEGCEKAAQLKQIAGTATPIFGVDAALFDSGKAEILVR